MKIVTKIVLGIIAISSISFIAVRETIEQKNAAKLAQMGKNQADFEALIEEIHNTTPYVVYITSGYRSTKKQKVLYEQNPKNAKPGTSPHEFKRAMDINLIGPTGWIRKIDSKETWLKTGVPNIAKKMGFRWGGNFKTYHDPVHFDLPNKG